MAGAPCQTQAARFLAQHVNLLPGHGRAVGLEHSGKFVIDLFSAPFFDFHNMHSPFLVFTILQYPDYASVCVNYFRISFQDGAESAKP